MLKRFGLRYGLVSLCVDMVGIAEAFGIAAHLRETLPYGQEAWRGDTLLQPIFLVITIGLWLMFSSALSLYDPQRARKAVDEFQTLALVMGFFSLGVAGALYFTFRQTSRLLVIYTLLTIWLVLMLWRAVARIVFRLCGRWRPMQVNRVLIVGAGPVGQQVAAMMREYEWTGLQLVGYLDDDPAKLDNGLPVLGPAEHIRQVVLSEQIDDVVLALPAGAHQQLNTVVSVLHTLPVRVRVIPDYLSLALYRATVDDFGGVPMINLRDPLLNPYQRLIKRLFDLTVAGFLALISAPVVGLIVLAIKLDSAGPVLFRQQRVGENGRLFTMYKFRSMVNGADKMQAQVSETDAEGNGIYKRSHDPRVTRVGRLLRRASLDELPQLFNVLKGDMSLVGPRPEVPWLVDEYELWQRKRLAVPQGITGWWQVNGRSDKPMHLHTDEDLYYVQNYSLWLDLYIFLKTPWVALRGKGAY